MPEVDPDQKVKIKIPKDNGKSETVIRGSVNGQTYAVAVDQEVEVAFAVAQALGNSGVRFDVVGEDGDGLSTSSTAPLTDTATRERPAVMPEDQQPGGGDAPIPTLEGGDGDTGHSGSSEPPATDQDFKAAQTNVEGQGVASVGGPRVGNDTTDKASMPHPEGESDKTGDDADKGKVNADDKAETVTALKDRIATIDDVDQLRAEHDAERNGAGRTTALAAIDQRIDALTEKQ